MYLLLRWRVDQNSFSFGEGKWVCWSPVGPALTPGRAWYYKWSAQNRDHFLLRKFLVWKVDLVTFYLLTPTLPLFSSALVTNLCEFPKVELATLQRMGAVVSRTVGWSWMKNLAGSSPKIPHPPPHVAHCFSKWLWEKTSGIICGAMSLPVKTWKQYRVALGISCWTPGNS